MKTTVIFSGLLLGAVFSSSAQDALSSVGGDGTGSGGSEAFAVGLVVFTEITGAGGSASQGIEHAYEIFPVSVQEAEYDFMLSVFPNPTTDQLLMQVLQVGEINLQYELSDAQGKRLLDGTTSTSQTVFNTSALATGVYFLNIYQNNQSIRLFKIIKN
jgi:hypothetical protein